MFCGACCAQNATEEVVSAISVKPDAPPPSADPPAAIPEKAEPVPPAAADPVEEPQKEEEKVEDPPPMSVPRRRPSQCSMPEMFNADLVLNGEKLGIDINYHDGSTLLITKINEGPVMAYNRQNPDQALLVGDRFVVINGAHDEVKALLDAVKEQDNIGANIRRAVERTIHLVKNDPSESHGLVCQQYDLMSLYLTEDAEDGTLLSKLNQEETEFAMKKDDYIVRVNATKGDPAAMLEELTKGNEWEIAWRRIERKKQ
jgi:hypothetical protein